MHARGGRDSIAIVHLAVIGPAGCDVSRVARMAELLASDARPLGTAGGGAIVLDDARGEVEASFDDLEGRPTHIEALAQARQGHGSVPR